MYQNDYIIAFDENGKPYIAHSAVGNAVNRVASAVKNARGDRQNHKYILKIDENGRKRYFYTQDEVKAYYEEKRKQAAGAVDKAKEGVKNAVSNAKNAVREATGQASRDRMNEAANRRDTEAANMQINKQNREASRSNVQSARQATREAEAERNRSEAALKGLKEKWKSDNEKAVDVSSKAVDALDRSQAAKQKAIKADLDRLTSMPWEFQKRRDAKTVQADAWREAQQAENEGKALHDEHDRIDKSRELTKKAYNKELEKSIDAWNQRARALRDQDTAEKSHQGAQNKFNESRAAYREADSDYNKNKAAYDKSLAGAVDRTAARARDVASDAREAASSAYNKAKDSANNTVTNAKNRFERMKSEFRDKAEQAVTKASDTVKDTASSVIDKAKDIAGVDERKERDRTRFEAEKPRADVYDAARANIAQREYDKTPLGMIDKARTAVKDKSEDLSAKAKSTVQSARDSVQGMIDNARSSTAKAVNEAWDKIPKNADGTVNPFDSNFQSAYNDWKSKKDKYDGSLTGQAKAAAEKATDSVKDMIDQAKKTVKDASQQISDNLDVKQLQKNLERDMKNHGYSLEDAYNQHKDWLKNMQNGQLPEDHKEYYKKMSELEDQAYKELKDKRSAKKYFNEYSDNDSDFDDKNYSKENHVEDTDFYTFKRNDGKSVVLEEDMKWVLPRGVDASNPTIKSALKKIANSGRFKSYDDWLENANDILGEAIEKVRDKEK